jgi:hypothetical protein
MAHGRLVAVSLLISANLSCAANGTSAAKPPAAMPTPAPTAPAVGTVAPPSVPRGTAAGTPPAAPPAVIAPAGGPPPGGPPRRVPLTPEQRAVRRDSLSALRTQVLQELATKIAGSENKRADDEFTNIKLMKDTTAAQLLKTMDYYGKSLSVSCTYCHVAGGKWDEDTKEEKNTTRIMIELVNSINTGAMSKLPPNRNGQTPRISCMTCHRGNTNPGMAILP